MNCALPCRVGFPILRTCVGLVLLCLAGCGNAREVVEAASLGPQDLLRWSRPAGGLIARIEGYHDTLSPDGRAAFVRIKNVGRAPLAVPVGEPEPYDPERGHVITGLFELQLLSSKGWRGEPLWAIWPPSKGWASDLSDSFFATAKRLYPTDIATVTLRPGQSVLVYLSRTRHGTTSPYTAAKVVIRRTAPAGQDAWSGTLSTPPFPIHDLESGSARGQLEGKVPLPDHFPQFIRWPFMGANLSGNESYYTRLAISNRTLLQQMRLYPAKSFIAALEKRLAREKNIYMRIIIASVVASDGEEPDPAYAAAKGKVPTAPANERDRSRRERLAAAKLALATLEEGDPIPRLGNLLLDMSMEASARRHVCDALEGRRDPRLIPYLVRSIKTDHDGPVMCRAMEMLAAFKNRAAFDGLVECLDNPFRERRWYKLTLSPDTWRGYVAGHLREMTGVAIGADSAAWRHWWETRGRHLERFK